MAKKLAPSTTPDTTTASLTRRQRALAKVLPGITRELEEKRKRLLQADVGSAVLGQESVFGQNVAADDYGVIHMMQTDALLLRQRNGTELTDVEQALARIANGTYGKCLGCLGDIRIDRLEAIPEAAHCMDCKRGR